MRKKIEILDNCSISKLQKKNGEYVTQPIGDFPLMITEKEKKEEDIYIAYFKSNSVKHLLGSDIANGDLVFTQEARYIIDMIDVENNRILMRKIRHIE